MDDNGAMYFTGHFSSGTIYKITASGESVSAEEVVTEDQNIDWFMVNGAGTIAYVNKEFLRSILQTSSGKELDLESVNFWVAADQNLYVDQYDSEGGTHDIVRITPVSQDTVAYDTVAADLPDGLSLSHELNYLLNAGERTLIAIPVDSAEQEIWEVYSQINAPHILQDITLNFNYIKSATSSDNAFYFAGIGTDGQPRLVKVDALSNTLTTITSAYDITDLEVTAEGHVIFGGYDNASEKRVMGIITADGTVEVLDDTLGVPAFNLISMD